MKMLDAFTSGNTSASDAVWQTRLCVPARGKGRVNDPTPKHPDPGLSTPTPRPLALRSMKQTLQLKLSQHLTLTPQLQQSIRLLQLSTLELNQELERFLAGESAARARGER